MKFIPETATMEDLAKEFDRIWRRVLKLEKNKSVILPREPVNSPAVGQVWFDVSTGTINVFNGTTYDVWTKD